MSYSAGRHLLCSTRPLLARARHPATMSERAPKKTPDEAGAPVAPADAAGASQSLSSSAGSNVPASSHRYSPHGGQAKPPPAAPATAHPRNVAQAQAQAQAAGVAYHPTLPDSAAAPSAAAGSDGDGTQTSSQGQAQKGDKPATPSAGGGGTSSNNSGGRSTTPSKQAPTAAAASGAGTCSVAPASSSANTGAAASTQAGKDKTTPPAPKPREYQPSPQSDDPNASPCGLMRLTTNKADKALYNYVRAVLGDLGEDGKSVGSAGVGSAGGGRSRGASPGKAAPVSLSLLRPSAALLTVVLLLLGAEEVKGDPRAAKTDGDDGSPPVGSLTNLFSQHLSDLVAYCRTLDDAITITDIVTFCLNFCKMGSSDDGTSAASNTVDIQRLRMALLKHEDCKGIAADSTFSKTLPKTLVSVFEAMSAQVRSDAEDSGDFTYLWEKCSKVHRREFARAFLGTSGYESRHEALLEASRCAYVMDRYYRRGANLDSVGNKDAVDGRDEAGLSIEQRIKSTVTKAACIALVYRCGNMEKEVREMDEKAHAEYEKSAGEKGGASSGASGHGGKSVKPRKKDSRADMPIPSPSNSSSIAKDANNDIIMENADSQRPQSYYAGSHRAPKTSQSIEAETLHALGAMIENVDGNDASSKQGPLPLNIIDTLVTVTNELVAFLRSPNTGLSSIPNSPAAKTDASKYEVTASQIEEEMAKIYSAFSADKKHFTALHSNLLEDTDTVQHNATTIGTACLGDLVPFLCSHWARFESCKVFTSLYFYKLIRAGKSPQSKVAGKTRAFFASPGLIEYTDNHGSFVRSSYIRYEALRAVAPTIRAGLVSSDKSILAQTPVAKVAILDLSTLEPFQGGSGLFAESVIKPMEENEWINSLLLDISRAKAIKPSTRLRLYLRSGGRSEQGGEDQWKDVMVLILNKVLGQVFAHYFDLSPSPSPSSESESTNEGASKINLGPNGELNLAGIKANMKVPEAITDDAFGAALLALYYFSLEAILFDESSRLKTSKHPKLILNPSFHRALLSVCSICLLRAIGVQSSMQVFDRNISLAANGKTDVLSVLELTRCSPYDYLKVSEIFLRSSEQAIFGGLPANIRHHINEIDDYLIQQPLWATSSLGNAKCKTLLNEVDSLSGLQIAETGPTAKYWPVASLMPTIEGEQDNMAAIGHLKCKAGTPPESSPLSNEYKYVDYLFRRMSLLASKRVSSLCTELSFPASVASEIWLAFRYVLRSQTFLLQDRHMDHVIVATTYAICKRLGLDPTKNLFSRIATAYVAINNDFISERSCHHLLQRVKINSSEGYGNVIDFYNKVYLHAMKSYLLNSSTLRATAVEIKASTSSGSARPQASPKAVDQRYAYRIQGTNVFVGKRYRSGESITGESKRARAIYSFGDTGRRDITVAQELVTKN